MKRLQIILITMAISSMAIALFACNSTPKKEVNEAPKYKAEWESLQQHKTVNDDLVIEPWFRIAWKVGMSDHGVKIIEHHAENSMGYLSNFPIKNAADINKLKVNVFRIRF